MNHFETLPIWIALPVLFFVVVGSTLTLLGALGVAQLRNFYDRIHAPTLGSSWGTAGLLLASVIFFSWTEGRLVIHELVIGIFIMLTTPVTLMFLGRAALQRDRAEGNPDVPGPMGLQIAPDGTAVPEAESEDEPEEEEEADPASDWTPDGQRVTGDEAPTPPRRDED